MTVKEYVKHRDAPAPKQETKPVGRTDWLRPPGAVEEALFMERCTACGDCVSACPHGAIRECPQDDSPVILPDEIPCYVCEDFPCIEACETEALLPVGRRSDVSMGLATVSHQVCTAGQGCNACIPQCPEHALAMDFSNFRVSVDRERCIGCGICEQVCRTVNDRIAIRVIPARLLEAST